LGTADPAVKAARLQRASRNLGAGFLELHLVPHKRKPSWPEICRMMRISQYELALRFCRTLLSRLLCLVHSFRDLAKSHHPFAHATTVSINLRLAQSSLIYKSIAHATALLSNRFEHSGIVTTLNLQVQYTTVRQTCTNPGVLAPFKPIVLQT